MLLALVVAIIALSAALSTGGGGGAGGGGSGGLDPSAAAIPPTSPTGNDLSEYDVPTGGLVAPTGEGGGDEDVGVSVSLSNRPDLSTWIGTNATPTKIEDDDDEVMDVEEEDQLANTTAAAAADEDLEVSGSWMTNSTTDDEDEEKDDLLAALSTKPDFSMLMLAIESAGVRETLSGDGPFTVFGTW